VNIAETTPFLKDISTGIDYLLHIMIYLYNMKRRIKRKTRCLHISGSFNRSDETAQKYIETLTAQLVEIHKAAPESSLGTGKKNGNILQQEKEQNK
jgi:hypothetical protein